MEPPTAQAGLPVGGVREVRRLETRARLFDAALAEIARCGLAGADVSAIASAAGVVRGTFYFHFPTKEHVLVELERTKRPGSSLNSTSRRPRPMTWRRCYLS